MGQVDVVARLQLRAEQFSSETGARFAELKTRARSAAQDIRSDFTSAFGEVSRLAQTALQLPRTSTGSLDLSSEISQLKAAAAAADQNAMAKREMAIAMQQAAGAAGVERQALLLDADAASVASLASEQHAAELRQRVINLEAVQRELNQTTSATRALTTAEQHAVAMSGNHRQGMVMLGQQFQDFTIQVQSGQSVTTAFVQQIGQVGFALSGMSGRLGAVGAFLTGPWGAALTIGAMVLVPFVAKLLEGGEAAKRAKEASEDLATYVADLGNYFELTTGKIKETNQALIQYAVLTNFNDNKEKRQVLDLARSRGNAALEQSRNPGVQYGIGPGGVPIATAPRAGSEEIAQLFKDGPNAPGIDSGLRAIAARGTANAGLAKEILDSRATYFKTAAEIAKNDKEIRSLLTGVLDPDLKTGKPAKPKKGRKAPDLSGMSNSAEEEIARINAEWDEQPRLIDKAFLQTQKLDHLIADLSKKRPPNWKELVADAEAAKVAIEQGLITAIGKAFEEPETLAAKGMQAISELDRIVADLEQRKPPNFEQLVDQAERTKDLIENGMNRPFREFVKDQRESLAIGQLVLAGRDAEAEALRNAVVLQERLGRALKDDELATVLELAKQHERIQRSLEDQRRIIGIYTGTVGDLQSSFEQFLEDLGTKPGNALKNAIDNVFGSVQKLQRSLISNAIFGGIDRKVEDYIRKMTGQKTPAEILVDQAKDAGSALKGTVKDSGDALADFTRMVRETTTQLGAIRDGDRGGLTPAAIGAAGSSAATVSSMLASIGAAAAVATRPPANDNGNVEGDVEEVVVTAQLRKLDESAGSLVKATDVLGLTIDSIVRNLEANLGIKLPQEIVGALKKGLPTIFEGVTYGQLGGSVFASITGGKDNKVASSIGGVLGEVAGKTFGPMIGKAIGGGLGKLVGSAAGPLGAIAGGILGNVIGGLLTKPQYGTAILTNATDKVTGVGRGSSSIGAATGLASSVQQGLNQLADALGAKVGNFDTVVGMFDGKYRVRTTSAGWDGKGPLDFKGNSKNNLVDFGSDQQAAIAFAIADAVRDGAIQGLSAASSRILQSGSDLAKAVEKVVLIESIPKSLKAMLDPVGAAVDDLNRKWQRTVDALKEGGASAEQFAQAQQLYELELAQVKNSTASATASLKEFLTSLNLGSSSPLSLRSQEATALAQLQPFLTKIQAGETVDQDKYRSAAQAYLDVERQLYGSTQKFFEAFDAVQAATNKAIETIDNVDPVTPAVESPFVRATATSTASTATNTATANELLAQLSEQMGDMNSLLAAIASRGANDLSEYIGAARNFKLTGTY